MVEFSHRSITALVIFLVVVVVAAPYFYPSGFAVASTCVGRPVLSLIPNPAKVGEVITASVSGLEGCGGATLSVREGGCQGAPVGTISCTNAGCNSVTFSNNKIVDYKLYTACFDKSSSGRFLEKDERAEALLRTAYGNDLIVKSVIFPATVKANTFFDATVVISNIGIGPSMTFVKYRFEVYTQNAGLEFSKDVTLSRVASGDLTDTIDHIAVKRPGTYVVKVAVNTENLPEADKSNNLYVGTLTVV